MLRASEFHHGIDCVSALFALELCLEFTVFSASLLPAHVELHLGYYPR